jgi:RNA polymerase sigma-70 factor (sigma-E family)
MGGLLLDEREERITALFDRHYHRLCGLACAIIGDFDLAEEIVMEAIVKTYTGWGRIRDVDKADVYLRRSVVNLCRSRIRRKVLERRTNETISGWEEETAGRWDQDLHENARLVWEAVRDLPVRQRACIVLFYMEDMSETQIAEIMDCSTATVRSQLSRARTKLRALLDLPEVTG